MKPVFPYPGGKSKLLKSILPYIDRRKIKTFCEPFAGGLAVLLAHDNPFPREVVNDISSGLIAFYKMLAVHPHALLCELSGFFASRNEFNMELRFPDSRTELGRAARWFWITKQSFGAKGKHFGRGRDIFHGVDVASEGPRLKALSERLSSVTFRNADACAVIQEFDSPDTFFFLDPPYIECSDTAYDAFSVNDMCRLRDVLKKCKARWILTCDDSPSTRHVFAGFAARENKVQYSIAKDKTGKISGELMVFSDSLAADYSGETITLAPKTKADSTVDFHAGEALAM